MPCLVWNLHDGTQKCWNSRHSLIPHLGFIFSVLETMVFQLPYPQTNFSAFCSLLSFFDVDGWICVTCHFVFFFLAFENLPVFFFFNFKCRLRCAVHSTSQVLVFFWGFKMLWWTNTTYTMKDENTAVRYVTKYLMLMQSKTSVRVSVSSYKAWFII